MKKSTTDEGKLSDKLVKLLVKEHKFKKRLIFSNISVVMDMMVDEATIQMLVPTIKDLISTSLKNDESILKLIDTLKKYDDKKLTKSNSDDDDDTDTDNELLDLLNNGSDEEKELSEKINDDLSKKVDKLIEDSKIKDELDDE